MRLEELPGPEMYLDVFAHRDGFHAGVQVAGGNCGYLPETATAEINGEALKRGSNDASSNSACGCPRLTFFERDSGVLPSSVDGDVRVTDGDASSVMRVPYLFAVGVTASSGIVVAGQPMTFLLEAPESAVENVVASVTEEHYGLASFGIPVVTEQKTAVSVSRLPERPEPFSPAS